MDSTVNKGRYFFKYFNMWILVDSYKRRVADSWLSFIEVVFMYKLVKKMKRLKSVFGNINEDNFVDIEKGR